MKKLFFLSVAVVSVAVILGMAAGAMAGIDPNPFKDRVDAITLNVKVLGKQIDDMLFTPPPDDSMPGAVKRFVVDMHTIAADMTALEGFSKQVAADIFAPGSEVMGVDPEPFRLLKRRLNKILVRIDLFLRPPPDDQLPPLVNGAVNNLRGEVVAMRKTVKKIIKRLEDLVQCTDDADCGCGGEMVPCSDFTTSDACSVQFGCQWMASPSGSFCVPIDMTITECADLSLDQCNSRDNCYTMTCVDGVCQ